MLLSSSESYRESEKTHSHIRYRSILGFFSKAKATFTAFIVVYVWTVSIRSYCHWCLCSLFNVVNTYTHKHSKNSKSTFCAMENGKGQRALFHYDFENNKFKSFDWYENWNVFTTICGHRRSQRTALVWWIKTWATC